MAENLFNIFGDTDIVLRKRSTEPASKFFKGNENLGKPILSAVKNAGTKAKQCQNNQEQILKKKDFNSKIPVLNKKSFLANRGAAIQATPVKGSASLDKKNSKPLVVYTDSVELTDSKHNWEVFEDESEFHKPQIKYDNFFRDILDNDHGFFEKIYVDTPEPLTPEPKVKLNRSLSLNCSYEDDFFHDDFSNDSLLVEDPMAEISFL